MLQTKLARSDSARRLLVNRWFMRMATLGLALAITVGCGPQRSESAATIEVTTEATTAPVPTFTPTPVIEVPTVAPTAAVIQLQSAPRADAEEPGAEEPGDGETGEGELVEEADDPLAFLIPTPTPDTGSAPVVEAEPIVEAADGARLTVSADAINVRSGPGTAYAIVGAAVAGDGFPITGRNEAGDWWQVCCFNDLPGWLYGPLVNAVDGDGVAVAAELPPMPEPIALPVTEQPTALPAEQLPEAPAEEPVAEDPPAAAASPPVAPEHSGTAGNFDPNAQYQIVHYRTLGFDDNNGGIFNKGGQQLIFVTVLDENGNGVNGAVIKDAVGDKLNVVVGDKGPGRAEIKMDWDPYKLYVAADPSGPVSSQISNQMNNPYPHIPDVVGMLGPVDNEYAICPTADDRCSPPFYHAHWSYEITFQRKR
jgi:uncharacterized protein YraI